MSPVFRSVQLVTSEELALEMTKSEMVFHLHVLRWSLPERRALLDHVATSMDVAFEPSPPQPPSRAKAEESGGGR